jgi:hypothetical protein
MFSIAHVKRGCQRMSAFTLQRKCSRPSSRRSPASSASGDGANESASGHHLQQTQHGQARVMSNINCSVAHRQPRTSRSNKQEKRCPPRNSN